MVRRVGLGIRLEGHLQRSIGAVTLSHRGLIGLSEEEESGNIYGVAL